jgi:glycosyltransferase involved in cell wall biosynthesis
LHDQKRNELTTSTALERYNLMHGSTDQQDGSVGDRKGPAQVSVEPLITAVVLTYNEEKNIAACLESITALPPVFVVDSGSTDRTLEISRAHGATIVYHPYSNHASQWQWSLQNLAIDTPWLLALDADFVITPKLLQRIQRELPRVPEEVAGIYVRHLYQFGGGLICFGGTKRVRLVIVRPNRVRPDMGDLVDFRFVVESNVMHWREPVIEYNRNDDDISVWTTKQDKFALRLAVEEELRRRGLHGWSGHARLFGTTDERFAWLRDRWLGLPLFVRPVIYFLYRYVLAGGFLDGRAGFLYHALQGFWLRLLVDWKTLELRHLALDDASLEAYARTMFETREGSSQKIRCLLAEDMKLGSSRLRDAQ